MVNAALSLQVLGADCALNFSFADNTGRMAAAVSLRASRAAGNLIDKIKEKRRRILLVDDEIGFRISLRKKLERIYGASVEDAEGGRDALEKSSGEESFELILMDISMPDLSGIETCKLMRSRGVTAYIVLMSARNDPQYRLQAEALGVTLLSKPLDEQALRRILLECGGKKRHE